MKASPLTNSSRHMVVSAKDHPALLWGRLKPNQLIQARVVKAAAGGEVELEIDGHKLRAKSYVPLRGGEKLALKLVDSGAQKTLKITALAPGLKNDMGSNPYPFFSKEGPLETLKQVLHQLHQETGGLVAPQAKAISRKLMDLLQQPALRSSAADAASLKQAVRMFSRPLENKLMAAAFPTGNDLPSVMANASEQDIKTLVLALKQLFSGTGSDVESKLTSFVDHLEQLQVFNQTAYEKSGKFLLPLPLAFNNELSYGQLFMGFGRQKKTKSNRSKGLIAIAFLLNLPSWGPVRADFTLFQRTLTGSFAVTDAGLKCVIDQGLAGLTQALQRQSFDVKYMTCQVLETIDSKSLTLMDKMSETKESSLNLII
jgi:hypothetical protein